MNCKKLILSLLAAALVAQAAVAAAAPIDKLRSSVSAARSEERR